MKNRVWLPGLACLLLLALGGCLSGPGGAGQVNVTIVNATSYPIVRVEGTNQPGVDLLKGKAIAPGKSADISVAPGMFDLRASIKLPSEVQVVSRSGEFSGGRFYRWTVKETSQTASGGSYRYIDSYEYVK